MPQGTKAPCYASGSKPVRAGGRATGSTSFGWSVNLSRGEKLGWRHGGGWRGQGRARAGTWPAAAGGAGQKRGMSRGKEGAS